ncbi:hypothetical protein [Crossiella cryophila]|uniref:Phage baseplate protein n=1 Tax=Crossiella cryophila TaxID=43355 RepID=A0A7W7CJ11_9PSEU|nr:hypothetical protein [Crossiella cryophila]MBB4682091.1 hypothetical protein [Crossiella cryophila]
MAAASELLDAWERGLAAGHTQRALLLHRLARPAAGATELLAAPVGQRDRELFGLRRELFGDRLNGRLSCPDCAEELEFDFTAGAVLAIGSTAEPVWVEHEGYRVRVRPPTPADVLAAGAAGRDARTALLRRIVLTATWDGHPVGADDLPPSARTAVAAAAAGLDPAAEVLLDVPCVACGSRARALLDIAAYLWAELDSWARGLLLDVHALAGAYGWTEPEVLALSPTRRRYYLELVGHD